VIRTGLSDLGILESNHEFDGAVIAPAFATSQPHLADMSLADYLAKNYLTADSDKKSKKRKRKHRDGGLKIDEDDISGWNKGDDDDDDDAPTIGTSDSLDTRISSAHTD
jgi:hypothetical protein